MNSSTVMESSVQSNASASLTQRLDSSASVSNATDGQSNQSMSSNVTNVQQTTTASMQLQVSSNAQQSSVEIVQQNATVQPASNAQQSSVANVQPTASPSNVASDNERSVVSGATTKVQPTTDAANGKANVTAKQEATATKLL